MSVPINRETNEHQQPDNAKRSKIQPYLEILGIISVFHAWIVIVARLYLDSARYAGYLVAYWALATVSTWLITSLGLISAQGRGAYIQSWRLALAWLHAAQVIGAWAVLPDNFRM